MDEFYKYIYDENEIKWFYDYCIPKLKQDEVFFFSLSARNKALNEKERELYQIGRNEMFNKMIIRHDSFEMLLRNLYRSETNKKAFLTNANFPFPDKCLTLYWNINPTNVRRVIFEEQKLIMELQVLQSMTRHCFHRYCFHIYRKKIIPAQQLHNTKQQINQQPPMNLL